MMDFQKLKKMQVLLRFRSGRLDGGPGFDGINALSIKKSRCGNAPAFSMSKRRRDEHQEPVPE